MAVASMSASSVEIQELADTILERLGQRIRSGRIVIHYSDGKVQRVEVNTVHKPVARPLTKTLDTHAAIGAR